MTTSARVLGLVVLVAACEGADIDIDAGVSADLGGSTTDGGDAAVAPDTSVVRPDGSTSAAPCARDEDCAAGMVCGVTYPSDGARPVVSCRSSDPAGGATGEACVDGVLCVNGESCFAGVCRELCASDTDCDGGDVCSRVKLSSTGDPSDCEHVTVVSVCHAPCDGAVDCPATDRCFPVLKVDRRATNGICVPRLPGGATGAPCSDLCATDLCHAEATCTERCGNAGHCPSGYDCEVVEGFAFSCLPAVAIPVCVPL